MLADLYACLKPDPWREQFGFSADIAAAGESMLNATDDDQRSAALSRWLEKFQPCLFGRVSAKKGLISYCFLTDEDLKSSDLAIQSKIQGARTLWTRLAYEGKRSAFVLLALSRTVANALPDESLLAFAKHLASLYLLKEVVQDEIYMDEIFLEMPGASRITWRWNVGVNYFAASGDGRWWQDHRIPGGLGFSANSVGHLIKSGQIAEKMTELEQLLGVSEEELVATKVTSLSTALEWAMRTIDNACETPSGKATELLPLSGRIAPPELKCPVVLPRFLQERNHCEYIGYYHTDITIPSEYFTDNVDRPADQPSRRLDFTYLFNEAVDNPDFLTTAEERRVRGLNLSGPIDGKVTRAIPTSDRLSAYPRLLAALRSDIDHQSGK
jgi:hypothetical protein